jgi:hypothetical protein
MQAKTPAMLAIFIAHVASRRISVDAEDVFDSMSDIGSKAAAFIAEAMRASFERLVREFARNLQPPTRDTVKTRNRECMARLGFNPRYEVLDQLPYRGGNKMGRAASCLFQVIRSSQKMCVLLPGLITVPTAGPAARPVRQAVASLARPQLDLPRL